MIEEGPPNSKQRKFNKIVLGLVGGFVIVIGLGIGLTVRNMAENHTASKVKSSTLRKVNKLLL